MKAKLKLIASMLTGVVASFAAGWIVRGTSRMPSSSVTVEFIEGTQFVDAFDIYVVDGQLYYEGTPFTGVSVVSGDDYSSYSWIKNGVRSGPELRLDENENLLAASMFHEGLPSGLEIVFSDSKVSQLSIIGNLLPERPGEMLYDGGTVTGFVPEDDNGTKRVIPIRQFSYILPFEGNSELPTVDIQELDQFQ